MKHVIDIPRTALEVFNILPEGTRCEVIDNSLYMSPSPTTNHQKTLLKIASLLNILVEHGDLGDVLIAPCDVYLTNGIDVVQPDILFISQANRNLIQKNGIYGSPDLVIELLSSNTNYDTEKKFELYQNNKIPEYIIIDPETKMVWHYLLANDGRYEQITSERGRLTIISLNANFSF